MRFRAVFLTVSFILLTVSFVLPVAAQAGGIPFFGPIVPKEGSTCPAGWGMVIEVINNLISFFITLAIVFVAPLMLAYAGFLFVTNPVNASGKAKANKVLLNTIVGIVIALAAWLIVNAVMVVLYNPDAKSGTTKLSAWAGLVSSKGSPLCLDQAGANKDDQLNQAKPHAPVKVDYSVSYITKFSFDSSSEVSGGIRAQTPTASPRLTTLLNCMAGKVPAGVGRISSISDNRIITSGADYFKKCATGEVKCAHTTNSCHYGGTGSCNGSSYAVDFGDQENKAVLTSAAIACGGVVLDEGTHVHVSVGAAAGCGCDTGLR